MENLEIEATKYTPEILMDIDTGFISISGKSYPENTFDFYESVMKWISEYFDGKAKKETIINLEIIYFNSSSSKLFFDFFDLIEEVGGDNKIEINWIYDEENEFALEIGEDFKEDFKNLNFNIIKK